MEYRKLGASGLKVSELSLGSWVTFGTSLNLQKARECMREAYESGITFFDNAETYGDGLAELIMGEILKDYRREELVISTKIFWGGKGPNMTGLSRKHLIEGTKNSLRRLQLEYVDLLYCHRPDSSTPIEETVRAMDQLVRLGQVLYWGTSEWSADDIEKAHQLAKEYQLCPPSMEQPQYNLFHRNKVEQEFVPLYQKYGMGITTWSPLNFGILTGKYNHGVPAGSRLDQRPELRDRLTKDSLASVQKLMAIADELGCTSAQLAIAWCLKNQHVSSVITGATSPEQIKENIRASSIKEQLTKDVMERIEKAMGQPL